MRRTDTYVGGLARWIGVLLLTGVGGVLQAHESPVDHIARTFRMWVEGSALYVAIRHEVSERHATLQVYAMDENADGEVTNDERSRFFHNLQRELSARLELHVAERAVSLEPDGMVGLDPSLGQTFRWRADLDGWAPGTYPARLVDRHSRDYSGMFRFDPGESGSGIEKPRLADGRSAVAHPELIDIRFEVKFDGL